MQQMMLLTVRWRIFCEYEHENLFCKLYLFIYYVFGATWQQTNACMKVNDSKTIFMLCYWQFRELTSKKRYLYVNYNDYAYRFVRATFCLESSLLNFLHQFHYEFVKLFMLPFTKQKSTEKLYAVSSISTI